MPGFFNSITRWLFIMLLALPVNAAPKHYTLKFATLAPSGSTWMNILEEWGEQLKTESNGRLKIKFYPGGVQGDEPDVIKKIRFNQLQGGAFTGYGIGRIYSPARVMELPFLFRNVEETDFVRGHFMEEFREGFHDAGYELLGWMEIGFVHMFSKHPLRTLDDMQHAKVWLWQGDPMGKAFFNASGISPIPLSIVDVYTSLSTGLIDTVYTTPLAAIAMQWFTKTPYMSTTKLTNAIGGLIVSRKFYDSLPEDLQTLLRETGDKTGERLITATRADNATSEGELKARGLKFIQPNEGELTETGLIDMRNRAATELIESNYIPRSIFDRTRTLLERFRSDPALKQPETH